MKKNNKIIKFKPKNKYSLQKGYALYNEGMCLYKINKSELALKKFIQAKNSGYESAEMYSCVASILKNDMEEKPATVLKYLDKAIKLDKECGYAYYLKAFILQCEKKFDKAIENYLKAIDNQYSNPDIYYNLAQIYEYKNEPLKGLAYASTGISQYPNDMDCYEIKGSIYYFQNQYNEALRYFLKAEELGMNQNTDLYFKISYCYSQISDNKKALEYVNKEIFLNKKDPFAFYRKGFIYYVEEDYNNAFEAFSEAEKLDAENDLFYDMYSRMSWIWQNIKNNLKKANEYADKAIKIYPKDSFAQYRKACILSYGYQNYSESIKYFKKAYKLDNQYPELFFDLSNAYIQLKKIKLAQKYIEEGLEKFPDNLDLLKQKAMILYKKKQQYELKQILEYLLKKEPQESWNIQAYGLAMYSEKKYTEAIKYLEKLTTEELKFYNPDGFAILSFAYLKTGEKEKSLNSFLEYSKYENLNDLEYKDKIEIRSHTKKLEKIFPNNKKVKQIKDSFASIL